MVSPCMASCSCSFQRNATGPRGSIGKIGCSVIRYSAISSSSLLDSVVNHVENERLPAACSRIAQAAGWRLGSGTDRLIIPHWPPGIKRPSFSCFPVPRYEEYPGCSVSVCHRSELNISPQPGVELAGRRTSTAGHAPARKETQGAVRVGVEVCTIFQRAITARRRRRLPSRPHCVPTALVTGRP